MRGLGGSMPQVVNNPEGAHRPRLFYSQQEICLMKDKTFAQGFGILLAGTVVAVNASTAGNKGLCVPFVPAYGGITFGTVSAIGASPMVKDGATGHVYVSIADSYKFIVGDNLVYQNTTGDGLVDCGAITAIDRTTNPLYADIACGAYTATNATTAKGGYVYVKTGASTPWSTAAYILDKDIDTGTGPDAIGAVSSVVISNAILYTSSLANMSAAALVSLGATQDGQHTIIK